MSLSLAQQVQWVRHMAPYIQYFRGQTFVIGIGGEMFNSPTLPGFARDCALLTALGIRLAVVHGARPQIDEELARRNVTSTFHKGARITGSDSLEAVISATGNARLKLEALLSRGVPNSPMAAQGAEVAGGNYITAYPMGVVDGIDYQYTGRVRSVATDPLRERLSSGAIVLFSTCAPSPSGEIFNLTLEHLAERVAVALNADKLVFMCDAVPRLRNRVVPEMTVKQAEKYLSKRSSSEDVPLYLPHAINACRQGVARTHLVDMHVDGALLMEFFTQKGVGTMIVEDALAKMRQAKAEDVSAVLSLIEPLERDGILVRRGREQLETEIANFSVLEHDGVLLGCAALYPFAEEKAGELACLAVEESVRDQGHGEALLRHVEDLAQRRRLKRLYVLTTHTAHWFSERGFKEVSVHDLPQKKRQLYNFQRRSKVLMKSLH